MVNDLNAHKRQGRGRPGDQRAKDVDHQRLPGGVRINICRIINGLQADWMCMLANTSDGARKHTSIHPTFNLHRQSPHRLIHT